jgi:hypothetical protein
MGRNIEDPTESIKFQRIKVCGRINTSEMSSCKDSVDLIEEDLKSIYLMIKRINDYNSNLCD